MQAIDKETKQLIKRIEQAVRAAKLRRVERGRMPAPLLPA
jgi:hypothetical protein